MKTDKHNTVEEYISIFHEGIQVILEQIRTVIKQAAPKATEGISYNMPAYRLNGILVYFAAYKNHIGFYATPKGNKKFTNELLKYKTGKGSIQFPLDQPIPFSLITKIVQFRVIEDTEKANAKSNKKILRS